MDRYRQRRSERPVTLAAIFLRVGAGVLAGVTLAACDKARLFVDQLPSNKLTASTTARFHSRPDLTPPLIEVRRGAGTPGQGLICVTPGGPILVDNAGQPVWVHPVPHAATNLRVLRYQDRPVLTLAAGRGHPLRSRAER